ncbi:four helix bundle protein [soil metagenome]
MGNILSYRDLRVWQAGMDLVEEVYRLTARYPDRELYGLTSQMRRSAVSIPSNIAEGHSRENTKEYLYHISVAQGSLAELQTQIEIAGRLGYLPQEQVDQALNRTVSLAKQLYALCNALLQREL